MTKSSARNFRTALASCRWAPVAPSFSSLVISASIATGFNVSLVTFAFVVLPASRFVSGDAGWHADTPMMSANTESTRPSELLFIEHLLDGHLGKLKDAGLLLRELQTTVNKIIIRRLHRLRRFCL